ncbi:MAG: cytochrome c oxidase subunit II [Chloroflexota bacterium]|nr:cytochrome c oxidase subunit II [Chloroflexota bacterium]
MLGMPFRRRLRLFVATVTAALLALLATGTASAIQPRGITDEAHLMNDLFWIVTIAGLVVFGLVGAALVYAMIRYRRQNDELPPQFHGGGKIEAAMVGVPVLIVIGLFTISMIILVQIDDKAEDEALTIDVTGFQFSWQFAYNLDDLGTNTDPNAEGTIAVIGTPANDPILYMPVDEPVEFLLKSNDVIHSFYVKDFLYKLDLIPGRVNSFTVTARETGDFSAQCAELCGTNHALMRFTVRVVERDEFDAWVAAEAARQLGDGALVSTSGTQGD